VFNGGNGFKAAFLFVSEDVIASEKSGTTAQAIVQPRWQRLQGCSDRDIGGTNYVISPGKIDVFNGAQMRHSATSRVTFRRSTSKSEREALRTQFRTRIDTMTWKD
jgi:hypothetical protein